MVHPLGGVLNIKGMLHVHVKSQVPLEMQTNYAGICLDMPRTAQEQLCTAQLLTWHAMYGFGGHVDSTWSLGTCGSVLCACMLDNAT